MSPGFAGVDGGSKARCASGEIRTRNQVAIWCGGYRVPLSSQQEIAPVAAEAVQPTTDFAGTMQEVQRGPADGPVG